jgi:hypothetical protein
LGKRNPALFNAVPADAGITDVRSGARAPRMNAVMERWVRTCRRELVDRTLITEGVQATLQPDGCAAV